jgi:hypothetical protein
MIVAVAAIWLTPAYPGSADCLFVPLSVPPVLFALSLSQAFLKGIAAARDRMDGTVAEPRWTAFGESMWPRLRLWLLLWLVYFAAVEVGIYAFIHIFEFLVSVSSAGVILGMVAACFVWAPRCAKPWKLALLTLLTAAPAFVLFFVLGTLLLDSLGLKRLQGLAGALDILLFYAPCIASGCLLVVAVLAGSWARHRGDAWFRRTRSK